jgi:diaminohydroxyphosphoribosylaminopyrimidine deaminase/5-amino-6-(5-phosphoribosylamino)uracil reductase
MIKETGIPRVVIGSQDSNPEVSGKGIKILQSGGVEVITGVLEAESRFLNRRFFTYHEKKRPYIILKWAETQDGFIDRDRKDPGKPGPSLITNHTARMLVHKWRSEELSIMAGTETILLDNPELNVREWPGTHPVRIVPDINGRLFAGLKVMNGLSPTIIFSRNNKRPSDHPEYVQIASESFEIPDLLKKLYKLHIMSVFVEGGARLIQSFINSGLWDESFVFSGNKSFISGVKAPVLNCEPDEKAEFRGSILSIYRNKTLNTTL